MPEPVKLTPPDWTRWLREHALHAAQDARDYDLHLAAAEWALSSALDINRLEDFQSLPSPNVEPFAHQVDDAILFFRRLAPRGLIADDVGLGKTVTAGLVARELLERGRIESLLAVCPKSLLEQWQEELDSKFGIKAVAAVGTEFGSLDRHPFWITSYHTARSRINAIRARKFDLLILDESHALRNLYGTERPPQVAKAFEQLMRDDSVRYCLMLTATPIQNRLWDMFSLLEVLRAPQPNPLGAPDAFRSRFIADAAARQLRPGTQEEFRRRVAEATIRTRRGDTRLLFPEREVRTERLAPLPEERAFIESALEAIVEFPRLVQFTHARTIMSSPWAAAKAFEEAAGRAASAGDREALLALSRRGRAIVTSAKVRAVVEMARASSREGVPRRLLVFTQRLETLQHLAAALREAGFADHIATVQGSEAQANLRAIRDFMAEPAVRPILLSTDTGAVGLNLQAGNIIVNYDLPWNPMLIEQRIGRVQRLGQKARHVIVYNLVLGGTIEDHIVVRLLEKLRLFTQAVGEMEELLELCGYGDEGRSFEQVVMDLVRKAAERRDVEEDLRRMEESRRAAEARMQEMREATERALASLRPKDTGARLEGLERISPRLPLPELVRACLRRAGAEVREDDGRLFVRAAQGFVEFVFDRETRLAGAPEGVRAVLPGTRAFDHVTKAVREQVAHHVIDATDAGLDAVRETLEARLGPAGLVVEGLSAVARTSRAAVRAAVKAAVEVATDRYETVLEAEHAPEEDGVGRLLGAADELRDADGQPFRRCSEGQVRDLGESVTAVEQRLDELVRGDPSVRRFCDFYEQRFQEDLEGLLEHARSQGHRPPSITTPEAVEWIAGRDPAVRAALDSLRLRFLPALRVDPVGLTAIRYDEAEVEATVRNRHQRETHGVRFRAIPLTGVLKSAVPGLEPLSAGVEAWGCPGGHVVAADRFMRCSHPGCTVGACGACTGTPRAGTGGLAACMECNAPVCARHRASCRACGEPLCGRHARPLSGREDVACSRCGVELDDGRWLLADEVAVSPVSGRRAPIADMERSQLGGQAALPGELVECEESRRKILPAEAVTCAITGRQVAADLVERSAVSGRPGLRSRMLRSLLSDRPCLPGEERICDETGALLLPDEIGECNISGRHAQKDLLEQDAESGRPTLRRLLGRSDVSGQWAVPDHLQRSESTGRIGLPQEAIACDVCHRRLLADEPLTCPETGRRACAEHFPTCEASGARVLPEGLGRCEVTGRLMRRALLARCPETGKLASRDLFETCEITGVSVAPEGLGSSSLSGRRARRSLLVACQESGQLALPGELAACAVTGRLVRPDLLATCPETGARFLPAHGTPCEESGALVIPSALGQCASTGRHVRRSLLSPDDVTGQAVLTRLLQTCAVTGKRTVEGNLAASAVSGKLALPGRMAHCEVSGRPALPGELAGCAVSGKAVHPDLLATCPETGIRMLPSAAGRCEATGQAVSPGGLAACEATGKRVRTSLLGTDEVTGQRVLASLLRPCARTGRRTLPANLLTSAVSGAQVLGEIVQRCEETGAPALPDELERCEITGKRVLPSLLERCAASGRLVLRSLLRPCEVTGKRVLPEHLSQCRRSGRTALSTAMGTSELSGEQGLAELLLPCEATGRKVFADELVTTQVSGKRVTRDRLVSCPACGRTADVGERFRCGTCQQLYCRDDCPAGMCLPCARVLTRTSGRTLTGDELDALSSGRPWIRRGWVVESPGLVHIHAQSGPLSLRRGSALLVFNRDASARPGAGTSAPLSEREVKETLLARASLTLDGPTSSR